MLSVRELLSGLDVRLLSGQDAAQVPVRWVHISELPDPTPWLSGGEILLTTGMSLTDPDDQRAYLERLADHQLAGLGFGTGFVHDAVPPALLEAARARDFPVFEVPYEVPFLAITESAFGRLVNEQYAVLRRAMAAQERLEQIILSERGLNALAGALAALVGGAVLVFDPRGELLARHDFRRRLEDEAVAALADELRRHSDGRVYIPNIDDGSSALALAVASAGAERNDQAGETEAWLLAVKDAGGLSDFDRLTLRQAVTLIALELLRARVAGDTERRLAGDVLAGMAAGELSGSELARRLTPFGLHERVLALACAGDAPGEALEEALRVALRPDARTCLIAEVDGLVCGLIEGLEEPEARELAGRVGERLADRLAVPVRLGLGRAVSAGEARRSFHEARYALETLALVTRSANGNGNGNGAGPGEHGEGPVRVATYRDIGSFGLLLSLQDNDSLRVFCDSILEPIESSEGAYGDELVRSLEAFIEENGQWERAAKRLYCHRHTLRYRIRRIEELTGRDLGNARDRIDFWLALRGRELVR